jgi:hypothetical protein
MSGRRLVPRVRSLGAATGLLLLAFLPRWSEAATRRALLIAIDKYRPPAGPTAVPPPPPVRQEEVVSAKPARKQGSSRGSWTDLDGAVNDAVAFRELLVARFGFRRADIVLLTNSEATRDGILGTWRAHLVSQAQPGDIAVLFYAGHGSQVRNSRTDEPDGMDESLVPADSYKGASDIRDKELNRLFNAAIDKGVSLTVIVDSCHSGSIARGLPRPEKSRYLPPDERDVADPPDAGPTSEERGALILSAAQDNQLAGETSDESDNAHGAFSLALLKTLQTTPPTTTAQDVFLKVKARMQSEGRMQEPVLAGTPERRQRPLFEGTIIGAGATRIAVLRKAPPNAVTLQGGLAVGLRERCELRAITAPGERPRPRLKVTRVTGLASAEAEPIEGNADAISVGDIFEVDRWVAGDSPLRVWWPSSLPSRAQLEEAVGRLSTLQGSPALDWVEDPTATSPTHVLAWDGTGWQLSGADKFYRLGATPSTGEVLKRLKASLTRPRLFLQIPPDRELAAELRLGEGSVNDGVRIPLKPTDAHYLLTGRVKGVQTEYAWLIPNLTQGDGSSGAFALPVRTDWLRTAAALEEAVLGLHRLRGWLQLESPVNPGLFPYHLGLRNAKTGDIRADGVIRAGESYGLVLRAEPKELERGVEQRYVYVFNIDSFGNGTLLFPSASGGNVENRVPYESATAEGFRSEIKLGKSRVFEVGPPFGMDTYILLSTVQPIPDPTVLQFRGVRRRGGSSGGESSLARLLASVGSPRRGSPVEEPSDWSIDRLSVRSLPAEN